MVGLWFMMQKKALKDHLKFHFKLLFLESVLLSWIRAEDKEICLPPLGCFSTADPFSHLPLPYNREDVNTRFCLRTRENPYEDYELKAGDVESLSKSNFETNVPTIFGIHGFSGFDPNVPWREEFYERFLARENANVIFVNWIEGSLTGLNPAQAGANVRVAAAELAYFCKWLQGVTGVSFQSFHVIGFSFGAQIAGLAGAELPGLGRITGLDPAAIYYAESPPEARLDPTDADFVDIIHTDGEFLGGLGPSGMTPVGHVDFYPNGGTNQPGCESFTHDLLTFCDHRKAIYYLYGSLDSRSRPLRAYRCDSYERFLAGTCMSCRANRCTNMGIDATKVPRKKHVKMYLKTVADEPYRVFHYSVRIHFRRPRPRRRHDGRKEGRLFVTLHGSNGTTQDLALNNGEPIMMVAGHSRRFLVTSPDWLGRLHGVTFRWEDSMPAVQNDGFSLWNLFGKRRKKRDLQNGDAVFGAFIRKYGDVIADVTSGDKRRIRKYTEAGSATERRDSNELMALQTVLQVYHPFSSLRMQGKDGIWHLTNETANSRDVTAPNDDAAAGANDQDNGRDANTRHNLHAKGHKTQPMKSTSRIRHRRYAGDVIHVRKIRVKSGESQESMHFCADGGEFRIPRVWKGQSVRFSRCEG